MSQSGLSSFSFLTVDPQVTTGKSAPSRFKTRNGKEKLEKERGKKKKKTTAAGGQQR
jgi:hypothetical protein